MNQIALDTIMLDESMWPREQLNEPHVSRMLDALRAGALFPPLVVEAGMHKRLVDGWHRYHMLKRADVQEIDVILKSYLSDADLYADAVRLNVGHGASLTTYDLKKAIVRLEALGYSREAIADVVRVPAPKVEEISKGFVDAGDASSIILKSGVRSCDGSPWRRRQASVARRVSGSQATFHVKQLITFFECDAWPKTSDIFLSKMDELVRLWTTARETEAP